MKSIKKLERLNNLNTKTNDNNPLSPQSRTSGCYKLFDLAVFSSLMKYRRKELGISLRVAARQIGISASNLSRIEHEKFTPDLESYYKCCKWSNSQMEYFFNSL